MTGPCGAHWVLPAAGLALAAVAGGLGAYVGLWLWEGRA